MLRGAIRFGSFFGRASPREFAYVFLPAICLGLAPIVIAVSRPELIHQSTVAALLWVMNVLAGWLLAAVAVRRFHDFDRSGWMLLLWIVPVVGILILIWAFVRPGTSGPNRFGTLANSRLPQA